MYQCTAVFIYHSHLTLLTKPSFLLRESLTFHCTGLNEMSKCCLRRESAWYVYISWSSLWLYV